MRQRQLPWPTSSSGSCGGTTDGFQCGAIPNVACATNQCRVGADPGTCCVCGNVNCLTGQQRSGSCGGNTNGFQCGAVPNIVCATNQHRVGANPGHVPCVRNTDRHTMHARRQRCAGPPLAVTMFACKVLEP